MRQIRTQLANTKFIIAGLMGCKVSVSGFPSEERYRLRDLVTALRGVYSPDFTADCTHLIVSVSSSASSSTATAGMMPIKLEMAKKWAVPVVQVAWLEACERERKLVNWNDFLLQDDGDGDCARSADAAAAADDDDCLVRQSSQLELNEISENCPAFLTGCHIYLEASASLTLKRIILAAGGVRHTDPTSPLLTHALIHQQTMPADLPKQLKPGVLIVHDSWIVDSYRTQQRLSEEPYVAQLASKPASGTGVINSSFTFANSSFIIPLPQPSSVSVSASQSDLSTPTVISKRKMMLTKDTVFCVNGLPRQPESSLLRVKRLLAKAKRVGVNVCRETAKADFLVLPCVVAEAPPSSSVSSVTDVMFECLLDAVRKDAAATLALIEPFARPVRLKRPGCLNGCVFSQTGFTGPMREFNVSLIEGAGGRYTDNLSKQNSHLLVCSDSGSGVKREFAAKWGIDEVSVEELLKVLSGSGELRNTRGTRTVLRAAKAQKSISLPLEVASEVSQQNPSQSSHFSQANQFSQVAQFTQPSQPNQFTQPNQTQPIFSGLVFAMSQRLHHRRDQLTVLLEAQGASVLWSLSAHCTHYLHQGNQAEECFREFRQARTWGCKIVSPVWAEECVKAGRLVDERDYPHTLKRITVEEEESKSNPGKNAEVQDYYYSAVNVSSSATHYSAINASACASASSNATAPSIDWNAIAKEREERAGQLRPCGNIDFSTFKPATTSLTVAVKLAPSSSSPSTSSSRFTTPLSIVFSGFTAPQKESLRSQLPAIPELNVANTDSVGSGSQLQWSPERTILLVADPVTASEKYFCACASGSW